MSLLLIAALSSVSAHAAPVDPALARAKTLFEHAEAEYALAHFDAALADYEQAFETRPLPGFLFNIGQCHRQLHHWERAGFFYRAYLEKQPAARNRALVESLLVEVDEQARLQAVVRPEPVVVVPPPPAPPPPPAKPPVYRRWYFWTAIGGAVVAGTAIGLGVGLGTSHPGYRPGTLGSVDAR